MNDIESLLRETDAPAMGVSADAVIAGARRTRRRRRTTVGAFGLAAALVVGVGVGADRIVANRASVVPASQYGTSGSLGKFFKGTPIGGARGSGYVVSGGINSLRVRIDVPGSRPLVVKQELPGGVQVFQDGQHTVVVAPLPRATDAASVLFKDPDHTTGNSEEPVRLSAGVNAGLFATQNPGVARAVTWNIGARYYSNGGERAQVASFPGATVYWYSGLKVYGMDFEGQGLTMDGTPASTYLGALVSKPSQTSRFAAALPLGAHDLSLQARPGQRLSTPQVRRLGTTSYDMMYVTAKPSATASSGSNTLSTTSIVQSVTWTDSTGRHTKSYS